MVGGVKLNTMNRISQLINYVKDYNNDLQGFQRQFIADNLSAIERDHKKLIALLKLVIEDFEDGEVSQSVINDIKDELTHH